MKRYIIGLDEGTTSARTLIFDIVNNKIVANENKKFKQYFPKSGWVEHDANEIWNAQLDTINSAIKSARIKEEDIIGMGITNQRESVVAWNKDTGESICPSIVWQCRRTAKYCESISKGMKKYIKKNTGLIVDAYFSASKIKWILENVPKAQKLLEQNKLCIGTIDSYLTYRLTKGESFITDTSNASRTMLYNINTMSWDRKLLKYFNIPQEILPKVVSNGEKLATAHLDIGDIAIGAILGDQQASLLGLGCIQKGMAKATYGTGCFILSNTGSELTNNKSTISTIAWTINGQTTYAMEGSIFNAGAVVEWLKDNAKLIDDPKSCSDICSSITSTDGVYFVPAFTGMGAPYWKPYARGTIVGLSRGTTSAHIIRAGMESMAYNASDIITAMNSKELQIKELRVDGGVTNNEFLMQFQSNILNKKVTRLDHTEGTVLGAIYMSALSLGYLKNLSEIKNLVQLGNYYTSNINAKFRTELLNGWHNALKITFGDKNENY